MHVSFVPLSSRPLLLARRCTYIRLAAALTALAAVLTVPSAASAVTAASNLTQPVSVSALPTGEVQEVLAGVPLKDFSATQLSQLLSQLPGLGALPNTPLRGALTKTIEGLASEGDTLGQLAGSPEVVSQLGTQLKKLLSPTLLSLLLEGNSVSSVLSEALGSLDANQILSGLLSSAAEPEQLIGQVLAVSNPEKLEDLLTTKLTSEPFSKGTVGELASVTGTTPEGLAKDLGTIESQLPASAMALTAPLADGKVLGVLDGLEGLDLGLLSGAHENTPEGSGGGAGGSGGAGGGSGGSPGGSGGSGGTGGGGSTTPSSSTTIVVDDQPAQNAATTSAGRTAQSAKVKVLSRKVKGDAVTLVVQVPAAGSLVLTGKGARTVREQSDGGERLTLRTVLTKVAVASLRKHRHGLKVKLDLSFRQVNGSSSSATTTVGFG
jgi:hypothetical protein